MTSRARAWGRYRKFVASKTAKNPVDPFIDPDGYRAFIDARRGGFRKESYTRERFSSIRSVFNYKDMKDTEVKQVAYLLCPLCPSWL